MSLVNLISNLSVAKIKLCLLYGFVCLCSLIQAQRKDLRGKLIANDDVEGIHILNKTAPKYTVSAEDGSFVIPVKVLDTLFISGLKYKSKEIVISQPIYNSGYLQVALEENINELDEVIVGKILTGSLESDLQNSDAEPDINFYDLGIPGFKGKPLTINERKLFDADGGPDILSLSGGPFGGGVGVNFHKLLNRISGRTKKLKKIVELDNRNACITRLRREYEDILFEKEQMAENLKTEYFLFCQEDEGFLDLCNKKDDLAAIDFLKLKLKVYKENRKATFGN